MELCSRSAGETESLGARLAELLHAGDVVVLTGDLGTGKTVLAKGIGRGLGVTEPIVSPTFTIVREYEGDVPLQHLDVYRLDHLQEAIDLGLDELLDGDAVTVIEWGEAVGALLPPDRLEVLLTLPPPEEADDDTRWIELRPAGPSWEARREGLAEAAAAGSGV
jgi:tRNA threonylcarbamoyladenosine biosynthesis protein TsaE